MLRRTLAIFSATAVIQFACNTSPPEQQPITTETASQGILRQFGMKPLAQEPIPYPVGGHIINEAAAVRLGKAFFWDIQAGSDGQVACATCHQTAGADARRINTVHPGEDGLFGSGVTGPGQLWTPVRLTNDDIIGSQGVARGIFNSFNPDPTIAAENCTPVDDPQFHFERRLDFRQAPSIFGAAYFRELFWGGEAHHEFNGISIWGPNPNNLFPCPPEVACTLVTNAGLVSQAVGPINNSFEMRCSGRPLNGPFGVGAKLLARQPLQFQRVSPTDSVLGALANPAGPGLICGGVPCNYTDMIAEAFGPAIAGDAQNLFTIAWGESIAAYERTLIPDRTPFDAWLAGDHTAMTRAQVSGLVTFVTRGKCVTCHEGPMLTDATVRYFEENGPLNRDGGDQGFHSIGLTPSFFDGGRGTLGPGGFPITVSLSSFDDFSFKTPHLRNVGLTAPYFHNGSYPTLEEVVEFYDRGGDVANYSTSADIVPLHLSKSEKANMVDFMRNALTDCRVVNRRAPFDHPELDVPNGPHLPEVGAAGTGPCP